MRVVETAGFCQAVDINKSIVLNNSGDATTNNVFIVGEDKGYLKMNVLFLTLLSFDSLKERTIYTDLLREFVKNGHQAALMAPTEVLAAQHMQKISRLLCRALTRCRRACPQVIQICLSMETF